MRIHINRVSHPSAVARDEKGTRALSIILFGRSRAFSVGRFVHQKRKHLRKSIYNSSPTPLNHSFISWKYKSGRIHAAKCYEYRATIGSPESTATTIFDFLCLSFSVLASASLSRLLFSSLFFPFLLFSPLLSSSLLLSLLHFASLPFPCLPFTSHHFSSLACTRGLRFLRRFFGPSFCDSARPSKARTICGETVFSMTNPLDSIRYPLFSPFFPFSSSFCRITLVQRFYRV